MTEARSTLRSRIIPCLLVTDAGLVKTVQFETPTYVGDPLNAVRIFNEKEVDELMVLDIDATVKGRGPNIGLIRDLAAECRMPLCYGGGVTSARQARELITVGLEKVAISSAALGTPDLIGQCAAEVGSQSVVIILDVRWDTRTGDYVLMTHNGTRMCDVPPVEAAIVAEQQGAGEIVLNSIDRDGTFSGYDLVIADKVREAVTVPLTLLGGAGSMADMEQAIRRYGTIGLAAGSLFVFKGTFRAVLINYARPDLLRGGDDS